MIKLRSIELSGFKSFPLKTRVMFDDRVTGIVGPNGCGKSNLADALSWVLGTQSAQTLRGRRMEDVIFGGTQKRKASGMTQVSLEIVAEEPGSINLNGSGVELDVLNVGRRLYRSGESGYTLNKKRCRLKDIHDALESAQLGFSPYALIAQGRIDWFLGAKPLERRTVIEEAARISGYKSKRRSAELRLELAQQNLARVNDIVLEVERALRSLQRQAAKARRYTRLREEFQQLYRQKVAIEAADFSQVLQQWEDELSALLSSLKEVESELTAKEAQRREAVFQRDQLEEKLSDARRSRNELHLELDRLENSAAFQKEQKRSFEGLIEDARAETQVLEASLARLQGEDATLQAEAKELTEHVGALAKEVLSRNQVLDLHTSEMESSQQQLEILKEKVIRSSASGISLRDLSEQIRNQLQVGNRRQTKLKEEKLDFETRSDVLSQEASALGQAIQKQEGKLAKICGTLNQKEGQLILAQSELKEGSQRLEELQGVLISHRERLHSLQELELSRSQYSQGVQRFLQHVSSSNGSLHTDGTFAESVETRPEFEQLVEEFLDDELGYVLVDNLDEAIRGCGEVKAIEGGKCTFLTLQSTNGFGRHNSNGTHQLPAVEGVFGRLGDLLDMREDVRRAFRRVLPNRAEAVVVSDLNKAVELSHVLPEDTFITLQGDALTPRGLLSVTSKTSTKLGPLSLKRQKKDLQSKLSRAERKVAALKKNQGKLEVRAHKLEGELGAARAQQNQIEKELIGQQHRKEQLDEEKTKNALSLSVLVEELTLILSEDQELRFRLENIKAELKAKQSARQDLETELAGEQDRLEAFKKKLRLLQEDAHSALSEQRVGQERSISLSRAKDRLKEERKGLSERLHNVREAEQENGKRVSEIEKNLTEIRQAIEEKKRSYQGIERNLAESESEYLVSKEAVPKHEEEIVKLRKSLNQQHDRKAHLELEKVRVQTQVENLNQLSLEHLKSSLKDVCDETSLEGLEKETVLSRFESLSEQLENFGPINMTALEEYQEGDERHQFLTQQRTDIETSIADTTEAIREINQRSREQFSKAFDQINASFAEIFQDLFDGGECGMRLLEEEDVLESGIEIFAQPPGKRLQNVMLLSGGEKALSGLALLMALFQYRPSRFCVLDEVDAPLDDANIRRFTQLIRKMSSKTQFIVITHNKATMEVASALHGVTMEEPGVSQLISAKF